MKIRIEFKTHEEALAYKQEGHGGWVLGRYWYSYHHTPSEVMLDCPEEGELYGPVLKHAYGFYRPGDNKVPDCRVAKAYGVEVE